MYYVDINGSHFFFINKPNIFLFVWQNLFLCILYFFDQISAKLFLIHLFFYASFYSIGIQQFKNVQTKHTNLKYEKSYSNIIEHINLFCGLNWFTNVLYNTK